MRHPQCYRFLGWISQARPLYFTFDSSTVTQRGIVVRRPLCTQFSEAKGWILNIITFCSLHYIVRLCRSATYTCFRMR